jgi:hypothetical protein
MNSTASADNLERQTNRDRAILAVKQNYKAFVRIAIVNLFRQKTEEFFRKRFNM